MFTVIECPQNIHFILPDPLGTDTFCSNPDTYSRFLAVYWLVCAVVVHFLLRVLLQIVSQYILLGYIISDAN